tara:strand:- start:231 stop:551 length:321 start_codon:yes stop_codon:yes gene_type:complete
MLSSKEFLKVIHQSLTKVFVFLPVMTKEQITSLLRKKSLFQLMSLQNHCQSAEEDLLAWMVLATGTPRNHTPLMPVPAWTGVPKEAIANLFNSSQVKKTAKLSVTS